jgi:5-methylcytosine-specific restriction endonuclease McrA
MRKLIRPPIAGPLQEQLQRQTRRIRSLRKHEERREAAEVNWGNAGKVRLSAVLNAMNGGLDRCMYCEYSVAGTIDHFCPRAKDPKQTFHWRNLFLACQDCQNAKGARFTRELLNPAGRDYRAWDHLDFDPISGCYEPLSSRAKASEKVFKWNRGDLPEFRWKAFQVFQACIIAYGQAKDLGDEELAHKQAKVARLETNPGLFFWILHWCDQSGSFADLVHPDVVATVQRRPEIRRWLD